MRFKTCTSRDLVRFSFTWSAWLEIFLTTLDTNVTSNEDSIFRFVVIALRFWETSTKVTQPLVVELSDLLSQMFFSWKTMRPWVIETAIVVPRS